MRPRSDDAGQPQVRASRVSRGSADGPDAVTDVEDDLRFWERYVARVGELNTLIKFAASCLPVMLFIFVQLGASPPTAEITSGPDEPRLQTSDEEDLGRERGPESDPETTTSVTSTVASTTGSLSAPTAVPTTAVPSTAVPPTAAPTTAVPTTTAAPTTAVAPTTTAAPTPTTAAPSAVPVPTKLRETNQGIDASGRPFIALGWSKSIDIPIVQVERDGVIVKDDDNLAYRDVPNPALVPGQQVTYRIRAVVNGQASEWSDPITVTVS